MVGRGIGLWLVTFVCATACAVPASAAPTPEDEGAIGGFVLRASNGYRIVFLASAPPHAGGAGEAFLLAERKGSVALYQLPATVTPILAPAPTGKTVGFDGLAGSIEADLGALGRIDLELTPSGSTSREHPPCKDSFSFAYPAGTYRGTVEFHGEEEFTQASATVVPLSLRFLALLGCAVSTTSENRGEDLPGAILRATSHLRRRQLELRVEQARPGAGVRLNAGLSERLGRIRISREVAALAPADVFSFDSKLRTASLAPPSPFAGSATFRRNAAANRFSGNLSVDFPGSSDVLLTGGRVHAHLSHARFSQLRGGFLNPEGLAALSLE